MTTQNLLLKKYSFFVASIVLVSLLILFQNCGEQNIKSSPSTVAVTTTITITNSVTTTTTITNSVTTTTTTTDSVITIPDFLMEVQEVASEYGTELSNSCDNWDFIDKVVEKLKTLNDRFGYNCEDGDCQQISKSQVAFYLGADSAILTTDAEGSEDIKVFKVIADHCSQTSPSADWTELVGENGQWKLLRTPWIQNGKCDNTVKHKCEPGTAVNKTEDDQYYKWDCEGFNGGTKDTDCQISKSAPSPQCGSGSASCADNNANNGPGCCTVGHYHNHPPDSGTQWNWTCQKTANSSVGQISCNTTKPVPQCGSGSASCADNNANNGPGCCTVGHYHNHPPDSDTQWNWTCQKTANSSVGQISCDSTKPSPQCGSGSASCADGGGGAACCRVGHYHNHPPDSSTQWKWTCQKTAGNPVGQISCDSTKPSPQCGSGSASCADGGGGAACCRVGHYHNHPPDSNAQWKWTCQKTAGNPVGQISCDATKPSPQCGSGSASCADGGGGTACCRVGHYHNHPPDSSTQWKWTCQKTAGNPVGQISCDATKPSPQCGSGSASCADGGGGAACCRVGHYHNHPPDSNAQWKWTCQKTAGNPVGQISCDTTKPSPQCGSGSASCADGGGGAACCRVGHYHNHPPDSNAQWKWTCQKTAGNPVGQISCDTTKPSS